MGIGEEVDSFSFHHSDTSMAAFTWEGKEQGENNTAAHTLSISEEVRASQVEAQREEAHTRRTTAARWVEHMTEQNVPVDSDEEFCARLKNGEVLCKLLNEMSPGVIQKWQKGSTPMPTIYNIDCFFQAALKVGLSKDDLFLASDLDGKGDSTNHPVVDCILRLKSLWASTRKDENQQARTPILNQNGNCNNYELKTPPMPVSMPLGRASAIKSAKGRGLQAAVSVTRLMQQCTSLLKDRMWSDSPNPSVSPLSACSTSPERTVEALGPVIESVLSSLTQEYERRLLQKESDLKRTKNELFTTKEKLECIERSDMKERIKEKQISMSIENKRAEALEEDMKTLKNQQAMTKQRAMSLQNEAKEMKDMCKSIKLDAMLEISDFQIELSQLEHHLGHLFGIANDYQVVCDENRKLYNEVLDLKGNIRVYTRVRPAGTTGSKEDGIVNVDNTSDHSRDMITLETGSSTSFGFEKAFDASCTQADIYDEVAPFIRPVLDGYNVCLFAYGQTGSGKTHTMTGGDGKDRGVNIRAIEDLFQIIQRNTHESEYSVSIQMLEIYNEQLRDLLDENQEKKLEIRSAEKSGVNVPGVTVEKVQNVEEVLHFMEFGHLNRAIGATAMNERSSRSHSVFTIHVKSESRLSGSEMHACLHLIDLAGSERVSRSEATGERLKEAQHINKSLSALGDVISALASKQGHIPYRNSKLTHLLQDSLNGNAKVLMLSHIAPEKDNCGETISTLHFATRVSSVTLGKAKKNLLVANTKKHEEDLTKKEDEIRKLRSLLAAERKTTKELKKKVSMEKSPKASTRQSFDNQRPIRPASAITRRQSLDNNQKPIRPVSAITRRQSLENKNPRPASAITKTQTQVEQKNNRRPLSAANSLKAKPTDKPKSRWM